jgi:hypothetical protein
MIRVRAFGLRIGLRHVRPRLGLAIKVRPIAVVDVARRIHPHQTRTASSRLWPRSSCGRRGSLSRSGSLRSGSGSRSSRSRGGYLSCRSRCRLSGRSRCRAGGVCGVPLLHALVSAARACFLRSRRVSPVLTLPGRASRRRRLSYGNLCNQQTCRHRNKTNRCFHGFSKIRFFRKLLARIPPNPTLPRPRCHQKAESARGKGGPYPPNR